MKFRKTLLLSLPVAAMALGAFALASSSRKPNVLSVDAAEYTTSNRSVTLDNEGNIHATFSVTENDLNMEGWLLCLFSSKPSFNPQTRKVDNSSNLHPKYVAECVHYFFAANTNETGSISVTWAANAADQKEAWSAAESAGEAGHTLADYLDDQDWYLVVGPRHYNGSWAKDNDHPIGAGEGGHWENCDYYVGKKSNVFANLPSGEIFLDLTECTGWKADGAKFGFYFWDDDSHSAYSDFATSVSGLANIYVASYEVDFAPTNMLALRMSSTAEALSTTENVWNKTEDLSFYEHSVLGVTAFGLNDDPSSAWAGALATVDGLDAPAVLDHYKRNGSGESEHYNESVVLKAGDEFTIGFNGSSYHAYTTHASLTDAFAINGDKIHVNTAGSYTFYFNTTESKRSVYITTPALAAADEWAQSFLGANCTATKDNWDDSASSYSGLSDGAKALFMAVDYIADPDTAVEGYVAQAVLRYDYVLTLYGRENYEDFMGRIAAKGVPASAPLIAPMSQDNGNLTLIVALVSVGACALALGGSVLLHKRKNHI